MNSGYQNKLYTDIDVGCTLSYFSENLAEHGIHPRYMHALINSPLLFGPLVAFGIVAVYLAYNIRNKGT